MDEILFRNLPSEDVLVSELSGVVAVTFLGQIFSMVKYIPFCIRYMDKNDLDLVSILLFVVEFVKARRRVSMIRLLTEIRAVRYLLFGSA